MRLFGFDKFWDLDWTHNGNDRYKCDYVGFSLLADKRRAVRPIFEIVRPFTEEIEGHTNGHYLLAGDMDTERFIMQLKSIKETGKIATL